MYVTYISTYTQHPYMIPLHSRDYSVSLVSATSADHTLITSAGTITIPSAAGPARWVPIP